jgi:hypothetical protein
MKQFVFRVSSVLQRRVITRERNVSKEHIAFFRVEE